MTTQDVDAIINDEKLSDANSAIEETPPVEDSPETPEKTEDIPEQTTPENPEVPEKTEEKVESKPEVDERPASEAVAEAKSLIDNLSLTEDKIFKEDGTVRPWTEVVPAGAFIASQLSPVTVTDKDGKTHEFLLLSDVEKQFPDGFEAKNNIEQMKFEKAILGNESKFEQAVKTYQDAETRYNQETGDMVTKNADRERIGSEYKAMADQGLVPKVGDPNDPKFAESDAVKELNKIMEWMDKTNAENAKKGLGQITSLYVAKQLMDTGEKKDEKAEKLNQVIQERKEVASLSSSPTPEQKKKPVYDVPMSRLADSIIAEEGLR